MAFTPFSNGRYESSPPTLSNQQVYPLQLDVSGYLRGDMMAWGTTAVEAAQSSANVATGANPQVRIIPRRFQAVLTSTPLAANGVYTGAWIDTQQTGDLYVVASVYANVGSAANGLSIQQSNDTSNANFTENITAGLSSNFGQGTTVSANTLAHAYGKVTARYWRVLYTNGATIQASFELAVHTSDKVMGSSSLVSNASNITGGEYVSVASLPSIGFPGDGSGFGSQIGTSASVPYVYSPSGSAAGLFYLRIPSTFKTVQATASGNTAVWTPTSGKKFRLMRYRLQITGNASRTTADGAGVSTFSFQDATNAMPIAHDLYLPATLALSGTVTSPGYDSGWIDLGNGILSASANNALNINLSNALTGTGAGGNVRVQVCGTEE